MTKMEATWGKMRERARDRCWRAMQDDAKQAKAKGDDAFDGAARRRMMSTLRVVDAARNMICSIMTRDVDAG